MQDSKFSQTVPLSSYIILGLHFILVTLVLLISYRYSLQLNFFVILFITKIKRHYDKKKTKDVEYIYCYMHSTILFF